jgi:hypothetical protein
MTLTLQNIRDQVRTQLEVDEDELPNTQVDVYIAEGFERTVQLEQRWPFYQTTWTVSSVADTQTITLPTDLEAVASILDTDAGFRLQPVDHDIAELTWAADDTADNPIYYSVWGGSFHLWPTPTQVIEYTVRGWRQPTDWVADGASAAVDADSRLHRCIVHYACSRAYAAQEDEVLAREYLMTWEQGCERARRAIMRSKDEAQPLVLNGGLNSWVRDLSYWWL